MRVYGKQKNPFLDTEAEEAEEHEEYEDEDDDAAEDSLEAKAPKYVIAIFFFELKCLCNIVSVMLTTLAAVRYSKTFVIAKVRSRRDL